jgi:hypothetical protein
VWKQGADENRTQPIVVGLTGPEGEMDRQAIGVHDRVNLARHGGAINPQRPVAEPLML